MTTSALPSPALRHCLREPIPEIAEAALLLDQAVSAHLEGRVGDADELLRLADMPVIRDWTESIWGRKPEVFCVEPLPTVQRSGPRMPDAEIKRQLIQRDGYRCRFCGIPVVRREKRIAIRKSYPDAVPWGKRNPEQHAALQAMWLQFDHILPHSRGGCNQIDNLVITCAPCNFGRMELTLAEVGLADPRTRDAMRSEWDGLERFRPLSRPLGRG